MQARKANVGQEKGKFRGKTLTSIKYQTHSIIFINARWRNTDLLFPGMLKLVFCVAWANSAELHPFKVTEVSGLKNLWDCTTSLFRLQNYL